MTGASIAAVHEAGHAVIGRVLKIVCGDCSVAPIETSDGHAIVESADDTWAQWEKDRFEDFVSIYEPRYRDIRTAYIGRILAVMAGHEATVEISGEAGNDEDDREAIQEMLADDDVPPWINEQRMRKMARVLIRRHRQKIQRVAINLDVHKSLSADEIDRLISESHLEFNAGIHYGKATDC